MYQASNIYFICGFAAIGRRLSAQSSSPSSSSILASY